MANRRVGMQLALCGACFVVSSVTAAPMHGQNATEQSRLAIVLPLELIAGQPATFAILTADGHVAPGTKVVLSNGQVVTTDESGRAHFLVPSDTGVMFARISDTEVREAADVLPQASSDSGLQATEIPKMVSIENHFAIGGNGFQGDADRNRIAIDGKAVFVLGSSPVQLIVMPAANQPPGPAKLTITEGLAETVTDLTLVNIVLMNSSNAEIHRGSKMEIVLLARGTEEPLNLKIQNLNPQTVQLAHGSEAYVRTTGGPGNSALLQLKGENAGSFSFAIGLESPSAEANVPVARDFLAAAQKAAAQDMTNRIEKILRRLRGKNIEVVKIRNDLQQMLAQHGSDDFRALIRASLRALHGE
ncbi:MAG TPA: hypothetical protein VKB26_09320 [Candidatus Acidoferrales bacterium]|nr:hypothetical protein [Candidatus Acidoferrales bacterium]